MAMRRPYDAWLIRAAQPVGPDFEYLGLTKHPTAPKRPRLIPRKRTSIGTIYKYQNAASTSFGTRDGDLLSRPPEHAGSPSADPF
jgi:hypothetical protein